MKPHNLATLRDRCRDYYARQSRRAILREGDPVEDLVAFVVSEMGRAADIRLDDTLPLALYFGTAEDRADFLDAVQAAKPGMVTKKWP